MKAVLFSASIARVTLPSKYCNLILYLAFPVLILIKELGGPVTEDTIVTAVLEDITGGVYELSATIGDKTAKIFLGDAGIGCLVKIVRFSNIQMIEME